MRLCGEIFFLIIKNVSKAIDIFIKNLNAFKRDINSKNNKSILKKLIQTKKVRSKIIKLKQDVNKPDFWEKLIIFYIANFFYNQICCFIN